VTQPQDIRAVPAEGAFHQLALAMRHARRIVALTGAGISTESGIPDYRGPGGVWESGKPPTIGDFLTNPESRRDYWRSRQSRYPELTSKTPNDGHHALVALERASKLSAVITQNIDGLHQSAGQSADRVIELHGTAHRVQCLSCRRSWDAARIQQRQDQGELVPSCEVCEGPLRAATILFGEPLPEAALRRAIAEAQACDLMLIVGTSLIVKPASQLPVLAKRNGAEVAIVNRSETPLDGIMDFTIRDGAGTTLQELVRVALAAP
jgi:NAD-dependent deacetylase